MDTTSQQDDLEKIDVVIDENETPLKAAGGHSNIGKVIDQLLLYDGHTTPISCQVNHIPQHFKPVSLMKFHYFLVVVRSIVSITPN